MRLRRVCGGKPASAAGAARAADSPTRMLIRVWVTLSKPWWSRARGRSVDQVGEDEHAKHGKGDRQLEERAENEAHPGGYACATGLFQAAVHGELADHRAGE